MFDDNIIHHKETKIDIQVNGKYRDTLYVKEEFLNQKEWILEKAKLLPKVQKWLKDETIARTFYFPGKVVNFVHTPPKTK